MRLMVNKVSMAVVMFAVSALALAACGSGGIGGNKISGNLTYIGGSAARANFATATEPLTGYTVQLVDLDGNVVDTVIVNADGNFTFTGVKAGDYTLVVLDPDGAQVSDVNVTIVEGDDAEINGTFTDTSVTFDLAFTSNDSTLNDAQKAMVDKLAELTGMTTAEIEAMRLSGMGWGQICHELGIHPGNLGLGHKDGWEPKQNKPAKTGKGSGKGKGQGGKPAK